ncbi:unnamed protein product [Symbiodinium natans]|uniref:Secreted protein n=1 Tax=Symbiodinium natans TaxID=878477 RepID=A0A812JF35_9DINO|nr:unnamed protein product [Symbiodinium natans]
MLWGPLWGGFAALKVVLANASDECRWEVGTPKVALITGVTSCKLRHGGFAAAGCGGGCREGGLGPESGNTWYFSSSLTISRCRCRKLFSSLSDGGRRHLRGRGSLE